MRKFIFIILFLFFIKSYSENNPLIYKQTKLVEIIENYQSEVILLKNETNESIDTSENIRCSATVMGNGITVSASCWFCDCEKLYDYVLTQIL